MASGSVGGGVNGLPAQPKSILRGHKTQVHATTFIRNNERLLTGDSEGFIVVWDLTIMRPKAVWQAHTNAILGITGWGKDRIISHGRDNKLIIWKLSEEDETQLSTTLPLDPSPESRPQPWILHMLEVNTMNFCSFSYCPASCEEKEEILVAVPNTLASEAIDIFHLPSQQRLHTVTPGGPKGKNGMVMAVSLFYHYDNTIILVAGFENGLCAVSLFLNKKWTITYQNSSHTQPILSLNISPAKEYFFTSGADATIAKHPIPSSPSTTIITEPLKKINTKHSGQQSLVIRSDNLIFATAGWDSKIRIYSVKSLKEVAVLKWHQVGCYAAAFSDIISTSPPPQSQQDTTASSSAGASESREMIQIPKLVEMTVKGKRIQQAKTAHWIAVGSKDGKVSLWDVF
ncbi:WD40-repeat-containing domain protein [Podospora fimiseda]|uniref:ASTRA-associated protein 1 n=1 Tax=Podospora fimiseda TaxID=252190 RepID=A0AAN7BQC6_9PEZI|nr:WD40-repeat-containing domain protein [Podospora fimiseda]